MKKNINTLLFLLAILFLLSSCRRPVIHFNDAERSIFNSYNINEIVHFLKNDTDTIILTAVDKYHHYINRALKKYEMGGIMFLQGTKYENGIDIRTMNSDDPDNFIFRDILGCEFYSKLSPTNNIIMSDTTFDSGYYITSYNDTLYCVNNLGIVKIKLHNGDYYELINY